MPTISPPRPHRPAANGELPPQPHQPDNSPLPDLTPDEARIALALIALGPATSPLAIAADLELGPHTILATLERPHVRRWIEAAAAAEDLRIELIAKRAKADALETLAQITRDKAVDPTERRRAASAVLRALAVPRAVPPAPHVPPRSQHGAPSLTGARFGPPGADAPTGDLGASYQAPPPPDPQREAERAEAAAKVAHWNQLDRWEEDAKAIRRRFDFKTPESAAQSVAKIITTADRGDPEAALHALFLVTSVRRNYEDPDKFAHHTRYLMQAAGGEVTRVEYIERANSWECVRVTLQPKDPGAGPLDLAMWFHPQVPAFQPESEKFWKLFAIVPWEDDNWRRPWREFETYFHLVDPLHPANPPP